MIFRLCVAALLALSLVSPVAAQDSDRLLDDILEYFKDKAFTVHLVVRLLDNKEVIVWDVEHTDVTVEGRALNVRLFGEDVIIDAFLTPFGSVDSNLTIVAYGQLWLKNRPDEELKYESFLKSLPVEPGEKVIFFPLGFAVDSDTNIYTIQLEIQLLPYQESDGEKKP